MSTYKPRSVVKFTTNGKQQQQTQDKDGDLRRTRSAAACDVSRTSTAECEIVKYEQNGQKCDAAHGSRTRAKTKIYYGDDHKRSQWELFHRTYLHRAKMYKTIECEPMYSIA